MRFKLNPNFLDLKAPTKAYEFDAGYDLYAPEHIYVPGKRDSLRVCLQVAFEIPPGYCGVVTERSSQGKIGVYTKGNIVDSGYTGYVHVTLKNGGKNALSIERGEKVCQIYFPKILTEELEQVEEFGESQRGEKAHGSSGN